MSRMKEGLHKENRRHQDEEKDHQYYSSTDESSSEKSSVSRKRGKRDIYKVTANRDYGNTIDEIMSYYFKLGDVFRAITFSHAAKGIREFPHEIASSKDAMHVPGVGKAIAAIYDELHDTGKVARLEMLKEGTLPKPPRKGWKKISNFLHDEHDEHDEHDAEHDAKKHFKRNKNKDLIENDANRQFCDHLQEIVDLYYPHNEDKDMIYEGLKLNRYANRIRDEAEPLEMIFKDRRRYKKLKALFDEFSSTGTSELFMKLKNGEKVFLPKIKK